MTYRELGHRVKKIETALTASALEETVLTLMRQGEDVGGGVNAIRLVRHLLGDPQMPNPEAVWAYDRLKPGFRTAFEQIPSLFYFEGD